MCVCVCAGDATKCKARKVSAGAAMLGGAMCRNMCECYATGEFKKNKTTWETDRRGCCWFARRVQEGFSEELVFELRLW